MVDLTRVAKVPSTNADINARKLKVAINLNEKYKNRVVKNNAVDSIMNVLDQKR